MQVGIPLIVHYKYLKPRGITVPYVPNPDKSWDWAMEHAIEPALGLVGMGGGGESPSSNNSHATYEVLVGSTCMGFTSDYATRAAARKRRKEASTKRSSKRKSKDVSTKVRPDVATLLAWQQLTSCVLQVVKNPIGDKNAKVATNVMRDSGDTSGACANVEARAWSCACFKSDVFVGVSPTHIGQLVELYSVAGGLELPKSTTATFLGLGGKEQVVQVRGLQPIHYVCGCDVCRLGVAHHHTELPTRCFMVAPLLAGGGHDPRRGGAAQPVP